MFNESPLSSLALSFTLSLSVLVPPVLSLKAQAQPSSIQPLNQNHLLANQFQAPGGGGARGAVGGGTRGDKACAMGEESPEIPLTLLVPEGKFGLTVSQYPQFLVYVPETSAKDAEFVLREVEGDYEYRTNFKLPQTEGIVTIELPRTEKALEVGKKYEWMFVIVCDANRRDKDVIDIGVIEPTELSSSQKSQIEQADLTQQAALYAEYGIWHEAVSTLATLQCAEGNNGSIQTNWQELLTSESVKLDSVVTQPLVECSTVNVNR